MGMIKKYFEEFKIPVMPHIKSPKQRIYGLKILLFVSFKE